MKKALAIVVALMMVMTLIPMTAGAEAAKVRGLSSTELARNTQTREPMRDDVVTDASLLNENFDDTSAIGAWWLYDADGDDDNWGLVSNASIVYGGSGYSMLSASYTSSTGAIDCDNWLVTPDLTIPSGDVYLTFQAKDQDPNYLDSMQVLIGEEGEAYDDSSIYPDAWATLRALAPMTGEWTQYAYSLSAYAGQTVAIAFRHKDNDMFYAVVDEVQVGIAGDIVDVTSVTVAPATAAINVTETVQLSATVAPSNATFPKVTWSSSNPTVAAVNKMGGVMGLAAGTATITATTSNGVSGSCVVTVTEGENSFAVPMFTYGIYDLDTGNSPYTWYTVDQYGAMTEDTVDGTNYLVRPAWHAVDQLIYAYTNNGDNTYDFVSVDPETMAVTTIAAGLTQAPWWMSYAWDTNTMYGGFMSFDDDDNIAAFNISTIDLATGLEDEVAVDVFNYIYTYTDDNDEQQSVQVGFLPLHATYAGGGYFIGADYQYNDIIFYAIGDEFDFGWLTPDDASLTDQYGAVPTYIEAIYYNPFDGMLYWECPMNNCDMAIFDITNGIIVPTGVTGEEGAVGGIECSGLFALYTLTQTYTVTFYDWDGTVLDVQEVAEGEDAVAPADPVREGYTFTGWDVDFTNVQQDLDVYATYTQNAGLIGDVDLNGQLSMADVALLYQIVLGQAVVSDEAMANADVDGNGQIAMGDVAALYQIVLGN